MNPQAARRFVAYYRVSTDGQGSSGLGLEAQQKAVRGYLDGNKWRGFVVRDNNGQALAEEPGRKRKQALSLLRRSGAARQTFSLSSFLKDENSVSEWPGREITMKSPLVIVLVAVALVTVSTLAVMNNACKSSQHAWCAPMSSMRHHIKNG